MAAPDTAPALLSQPALETLLHLEGRARAATRLTTLGFTLTNESLALFPYRQAALFLCDALGTLRLSAASGLVSVAEDSPYTTWLSRYVRSLPALDGPTPLDLADAADDIADGWIEWLPGHLLAVPLSAPDGTRVGLALYAREQAWLDDEKALVARLHATYGYCAWALSRSQPRFVERLGRWRRTQAARWTALALVASLLIPVRLSTLAPAEVVALHAPAVAAPQDGVIKVFHVQPNVPVKAGQPLFSLDDTTLFNRREVALKALAIAQADALVAQQKAFDDTRSKAEMAAAQGRVKEKEAELAAISELLGRIEVRAERDGIAVFGDPNDWLGRPVQTGERVMQLADPRDAGVLVWLPVGDALNLEAGAPLRLFLHTQPLSPLDGELLQTSYQAVTSPDGVASYRLRGRFTDSETPRIGLKGTARVSGGWAPLAYYVMRRPLASLREWTGL